MLGLTTAKTPGPVPLGAGVTAKIQKAERRAEQARVPPVVPDWLSPAGRACSVEGGNL